MINHYSVLKKELIKKLDVKENGIYVDCTLGFGGHTKLIAEIAKKGKIISFDQDPIAIKNSKHYLREFKNIIYVLDNFKNIKKRLIELGIEKVDGFIYDLGTSYYQLTSNSRGFTYHGESKLDMRMNPDQEISAIEILNNYSEEKLAKIFLEYGDERRAHKLAKEIVKYRNFKKIVLNFEFNKIIKLVKGYNKHKHPAKNIYQALRIEVNNEIETLIKSLKSSLDFLKVGGSILVITFHSVEDKIVKDFFWKQKEMIEITTKENIHHFKSSKVIYPSKEEINENRASRSAKLRTLTKIK